MVDFEKNLDDLMKLLVGFVLEVIIDEFYGGFWIGKHDFGGLILEFRIEPRSDEEFEDL